MFETKHTGVLNYKNIWENLSKECRAALKMQTFANA